MANIALSTLLRLALRLALILFLGCSRLSLDVNPGGAGGWRGAKRNPLRDKGFGNGFHC